MRAVVFEAFNETPQAGQPARSVTRTHGVVLKVEATGVCRSDWHGWVGHDPDIKLAARARS
jgi:alcohol dehydrogenase